MSPLFWNYLLAIDPSGRRFRGLIEDLGTLSLEPVSALMSHPAFRASDSEKLKKLKPRHLEAAIAAGVEARTASQINDLFGAAEFVSPGLFLHGEADCLNQPTIAIVGTRTCSPYGQACSYKFAEAFVRAGATVVSGGAFGIDKAAHEGALAGGGKTASVMGAGIDVYHPSAHKLLFERIRKQGVLLSQFPVGTPSLPGNFPARNPTIAALSQAVVVIEAPEKSGALRTARAAAELGRDVFVVPGAITSFGFRGSHALIRDGATLVDHPDQVLDALGLEKGYASSTLEPVLNPMQQAIMAALSESPIASEKIAEMAALDPSETLVELTMLEMEGLILRHSAGYALKP